MQGKAAPPAKHHFAALDGMRGVAALVVMGDHMTRRYTDYLDRHGYLAVDFFFLLSGFVIAYAYETKLRAGLPVWKFLRIRAIRLYPLIVLGCAIGAVVFGLQVRKAGGVAFSDIVGAGLSGIFLIPYPRQLGAFESMFPTNVPAWSLFWEMVVNVMFALIATRLTNARLMVAIAISGALVIATALQFQTLDVGATHANFFGGFVRATFPFLLGILMYRFRPTPRFGWGAALLIAAGLFLCLTAPLPRSVGYDLFCAFVAFPIIVWFGSAVKTDGSTPTKTALFAGAISYPLYILHYPLVQVIKAIAAALKFEGIPLTLFLAAAAVGIVFGSYLVLRIFDEPIRNWLSKRHAR